MKEKVDSIREKGQSAFLLNLLKLVRRQQLFDKAIHNNKQNVMLCLCLDNSLHCFNEGIAEISSSIVLEFGKDRMIEVSVESHELLRVDGKDVNGIEHAQVLDLNDEGERWEGDVLNNQPYGWGVLFDSENRKAYEGFRIGEVNVCYGRSYYSDIGMIEYEGEWCEGKRWGRGVQYDRNGESVIEGEWMNDVHVERRAVLDEENPFLHSCVEELIVQDHSCKGREWRVLDLSFIPRLRLLQVGDDCFDNVDEVKLIGLNRLESVVIGKACFMVFKKGYGFNPNRHFYLKNCERLRELKIGCCSFSDDTVCEIENVPYLEVIEMRQLTNNNFNSYDRFVELKSCCDGMRL